MATGKRNTVVLCVTPPHNIVIVWYYESTLSGNNRQQVTETQDLAPEECWRNHSSYNALVRLCARNLALPWLPFWSLASVGNVLRRPLHCPLPKLSYNL